MNPKTRRILFSFAILCWSAVLLYFYSSGRINKYLAPDFRPTGISTARQGSSYRHVSDSAYLKEW